VTITIMVDLESATEINIHSHQIRNSIIVNSSHALIYDKFRTMSGTTDSAPLPLTPTIGIRLSSMQYAQRRLVPYNESVHFIAGYRGSSKHAICEQYLHISLPIPLHTLDTSI